MNNYRKLSRQILGIFWGLVSTFLFGLCLYFGTDIWQTGSIRLPDFINGGHNFDVGILAKPLSLLVIGLGGLFLMGLVRNIWSKVRGLLLLLMFCVLGPVFLSTGVALGSRALDVSDIPEGVIYFPGFIGAALLLLFGAYITWVVIREMYLLWRS